MPSLVLHIGYPKTATSWLQKALFRDESEHFSMLAAHAEVDKYITRPHALNFDLAESAEFFNNRLSRAGEQSKFPVLSSEIICGNPFYGGREAIMYIERVKKIFPLAKILVTIRSQPSMYASVYKQYIRRGGVLSPESFFNPNLAPGYYGFDPLFCEYDKLFKLLEKTFGPQKVLFLCYEEFQINPQRFIQRLLAFCELDINTEELKLDFSKRIGLSSPDFVLPILRMLNRYRGGAMNPVNPGIWKNFSSYMYRKVEWAGSKSTYKPESRLKQYCNEIACDRYRESNANLASATGEDLSEFGYPL